jgi:hypothetical protein
MPSRQPPRHARPFTGNAAPVMRARPAKPDAASARPSSVRARCRRCACETRVLQLAAQPAVVEKARGCTRVLDAGQAVSFRHIGKELLHRLEPTFAFLRGDRGDAAHFDERALGDQVAGESARVFDLERKRPFGARVGPESLGHPETDVVHVQAQNGEPAVALQAGAGQLHEHLGRRRRLAECRQRCRRRQQGKRGAASHVRHAAR